MALVKLNFRHEDIINTLIQYPHATARDLSQMFGYSEAWISTMVNSDAFLARMAARRKELIDPMITATLEERYRGLANQALDVVSEKLSAERDGGFALEALNIAGKALGFGQQKAAPTVNQQFVIQVPAKSTSVDEWQKAYQGEFHSVSESEPEQPN